MPGIIEITSASDHPVAKKLFEVGHETVAPILFSFPDGSEVTVEKGFGTDLASIPRRLWCLGGFSPLDNPESTLAAVLHDRDCENPHVDRATADARFRQVLRGPATFNGRALPRMSWWRSLAFYLAVRINSEVVEWKRRRAQPR